MCISPLTIPIPPLPNPFHPNRNPTIPRMATVLVTRPLVTLTRCPPPVTCTTRACTPLTAITMARMSFPSASSVVTAPPSPVSSWKSWRRPSRAHTTPMSSPGRFACSPFVGSIISFSVSAVSLSASPSCYRRAIKTLRRASQVGRSYEAAARARATLTRASCQCQFMLCGTLTLRVCFTLI